MSSSSDFKVHLPFGAPPVLPDVKQQLESYIIKTNNLPINNFEYLQNHFPRTPNVSRLFHFELLPGRTRLRVHRDITSGKLIDFKEVLLDGNPLPSITPLHKSDIKNETELEDDFFKKDLERTPPWFSRGYDFTNKSSSKSGKETDTYQNDVINLISVLQKEQNISDLLKDSNDDVQTNEKLNTQGSLTLHNDDDGDDAILNDIPEEVKFTAPVIRISEVGPLKQIVSTDWAEILDVSHPVSDFHLRVPDMAFKYNFELDTFQKQAILKLEEHCSVLVSAHTSAGKTAVAEYAIGLSQRHMTRVIYTSPIKALSNQKYRDFKKTFNDVGLITGDFQINQTATCLIMTTEILKSMLLIQNEIIRDLEYVIFDEVHYINDSDRGHVWEEVLILLPQQVSIVMLSATIPNALSFADWVGRTKKRKIYVISTLQRPVPLEHFLYTGSGGNSKDERFLILNSKNVFQKKGYLAAVEAKKKRESKNKEIVKVKTMLSVKQEKTMWIALLEHLQKHDKLPVVAFTLSRQRCDQNAENLLSLDLTTAKEKSHIRYFIQQSIQRLKEPDQKLPQILKMQKLLEIGIGIHHSGILPILKEIVEMLFQEKCVKVLFATETFAMGVNMPAKTVIFDSIRKYDGVQSRTLTPSEYIQMAGRAGRRGLDETGTVILLCKGDVPSEQELMDMMLGSPLPIDSQFRLTYSIILKLERKRVAAEGKVTVEELMANSFKEANHVKKQKVVYSKSLHQVEKELDTLEINVLKGTSWDKLCDVCQNCLDYLDVWERISLKLYTDKQGVKVLVPGRIVYLTYKQHINKLGLLLTNDVKKDVYKVLVLCDRNVICSDEDDFTSEEYREQWYKVISLSDNDEKLFIPDNIGHHAVITINSRDIFQVTTLLIKIDPKILLGDWDNRQIPRFRDNPPGKSFQKALEELTEITNNINMKHEDLKFINLLKDMGVNKDEEIQDVNRLLQLREKIKSFQIDSIVDYQKQLKEIFKLKVLEQKRASLQYLMSYKSLSLYEDYQNRLAVLKYLKYVDSKNSVQIKGNVACEMSNHELLITELVLRNALNDLQPAEIAALLSCFVYQGKKQDEIIRLPEALQKGVDLIREVANEVWRAEAMYGVSQHDSSGNVDNLNFDLVPVVLEWAREKPFAQIMTLTDIQEGIIVRCIQQLNETIRDVKDAARIIGEPTLQQKMEEASSTIKRDIVFAASLYMQ